MVAPLPVTATSRSVALRFRPDTDLQAGSLLNLTSSPNATATARTVQGAEPTGAVATARGIGAGDSRYYRDLEDARFFRSRNLSIDSGGGSISGDAVATAYATGRGDTDASALATNIGLANIPYLDRYGGAFNIGTASSPFTARAVAGTGSILGPLARTTPNTTLNASAVVRGLEAGGSSAASPFRANANSLDPDSLASLRRDQQDGPPPITYGSDGEPLLDLRDRGGLVSADLLLFRDSADQGSISFYRVLDRNGTVRAADGTLLRPRDEGYAAAALAPANLVSELQDLHLDDRNDVEVLRNRLIDEAGLLAPILTTQSGDQTPQTRFAFADANPDRLSPFRTYRDGGATRPPSDEEIGAPQLNTDQAAPQLQERKDGATILDFSNTSGLSTTKLDLKRDGAYSHELGFYRVVDAKGGVRRADGKILYPSNPGYLSAALSEGNLVGELQGLTVPQDGGSLTKPLLIDEAGLLAPFVTITRLDGNTATYFSFPELNPDNSDYFRISPDGSTLLVEDLEPSDWIQRPGEPDYNDFTAGFRNSIAIPLPLFDFSSSDRPLITSFRNPPAPSGEIRFYRIADANGAVSNGEGGLVYPGDPGYRDAALAPANLVESLDRRKYALTDETGLIAPYLVLGDEDPSGIQERFAFPSANPDGESPFTVEALNRFSSETQQATLEVLHRLPSAAYGNKEHLVGVEDVRSQPLSLFDFRNSDGPYRTELALTRREADPDSTYGFYRVRDVNGTVLDSNGNPLRPGDPGYAAAALRPDNLVTELADLRIPDGRTSVTIPVEIDEKSILAPYASTQTVDGGRVNLFPWPSANPFSQAFPIAIPVGAVEPVRRARPRPSETFYGQPTAVVRADAELTDIAPGSTITGNLNADAVGIESYLVKAVPFGNGDGTATMGGTAIATLRTDLEALRRHDSLNLNGRAVGVENSRLYGAPTVDTTVEGIGMALTESIPAGSQLNRLQGIGILNSRIDTNQGNDTVRVFGGMSDGGLPIPAGASPTSRDAAGMDNSAVTTGMGDDLVFGRILNEIEGGIDHDGDGELEDDVYLDRAALSDPSRSGFDGIRHSSVNTGLGNDRIGGSSSVSHFNAEQGNDVINLDRARFSSFWGGIGNDALGSSGPALHNVFWGGLGNDRIDMATGRGNLLDGGLGQDVINGGQGVDHFVVSDAAGALRASSSTTIRDELADTPLWATLNQQQKEQFWSTGQLRATDGQLLGLADTYNNFEAGEGGDVLHLSDSLAAITQKLWESKGAIFGVTSQGDLTVSEASGDGTNKVGIVVGALADIQKLGIGSPTIAYATDTRQLMFDADGIWSSGAQSLGTLNISNGGTLTRSNLQFGSISGQAAGPAPSGQSQVL